MKKCYTKFTVLILALIIIASPAFAAGTEVSTFAGSSTPGASDGKTAEAQFFFPYGLCFDADDNLIVVDSYNNLIRKVEKGQVTTLAGHSGSKDELGYPRGGFVDGDSKEAMFNRPRTAVADSKGDIYVADTGNNVIRKISGGKVYTFAGTGEAGYRNGSGRLAQFNCPSGLTIDSQDNLYVADSLNNAIRKITPEGVVSTYAGTVSGGYRDGTAENALFNEPADIALNKVGIMYILDTGNQLVRKLESGMVSTVSGFKGELIGETSYAQGGFANGSGEAARYNFPKGIAAGDNGIVFIADTWNHRIRALKPNGEVVTLSGTGVPGNADGSLTQAQFNGPVDVLYSKGTLYVADLWNNTIRTVIIDVEELTGIVDRNELIEGIDFGRTTTETQVWNGKSRIAFPDVKPYLLNKKVYIPLRYIFESWGAKVEWIADKKQVKVTKGTFVKILTPGEDETFLDKGGRTMIEMNSYAKITGLRTEWYPEYNAVVIAGDGK